MKVKVSSFFVIIRAMVEAEKLSFWNRKLSRRDLIKCGIAVGVNALLGGCSSKTETIKRLPEITEGDVKTIALRCISDFNKVLGLSIPERDAASKVHLVTDLALYQDILKKSESGYQPTNEKNRPGITTDSSYSSGKQIFLYKDAIDELTGSLPASEQGIGARENLVEWIIYHEFSHWSASNYPSIELHDLIYGKMFVNDRNIRGRQITPDMVVGAEVKAFVNGIRKTTFENLEESEAFIIGDFVAKKRGRPQIVTYLTSSDMGIEPQVNLIRDLQGRIGLDLDNGVKLLAALRGETGGRERYGRFIGEKFGIVETGRLFFSMSLLNAINIGDANMYQRLIIIAK